MPREKLSPNFYRDEFECRCGKCGGNTVDAAALAVVQGVRDHFGKPVTITSAFRCPAHNRAEGGSTRSQHLWGRAVDFQVVGVPAGQVAQYLAEQYRGQFAIGKYSDLPDEKYNFCHFDPRNSEKRWQRQNGKLIAWNP